MCAVYAVTLSGRVVEHYTNESRGGSWNPDRRDGLITDSADRPVSPLLYLTLVQILLTTNIQPPPLPPPPPPTLRKKNWYPVSKG